MSPALKSAEQLLREAREHLAKSKALRSSFQEAEQRKAMIRQSAPNLMSGDSTPARSQREARK
jgi:hypothetical protein